MEEGTDSIGTFRNTPEIRETNGQGIPPSDLILHCLEFLL